MFNKLAFVSLLGAADATKTEVLVWISFFMNIPNSSFAIFACFKGERRLETRKLRFCWLSINLLSGGEGCLPLISIENIIIIMIVMIPYSYNNFHSVPIYRFPAPRSGLPGRLEFRKRRFFTFSGLGRPGNPQTLMFDFSELMVNSIFIN